MTLRERVEQLAAEKRRTNALERAEMLGHTWNDMLDTWRPTFGLPLQYIGYESFPIITSIPNPIPGGPRRRIEYEAFPVVLIGDDVRAVIDSHALTLLSVCPFGHGEFLTRTLFPTTAFDASTQNAARRAVDAIATVYAETHVCPVCQVEREYSSCPTCGRPLAA